MSVLKGGTRADGDRGKHCIQTAGEEGRAWLTPLMNVENKLRYVRPQTVEKQLLQAPGANTALREV